jgi:hypothetical protein
LGRLAGQPRIRAGSFDRVPPVALVRLKNGRECIVFTAVVDEQYFPGPRRPRISEKSVEDRRDPADERPDRLLLVLHRNDDRQDRARTFHQANTQRRLSANATGKVPGHTIFVAVKARDGGLGFNVPAFTASLDAAMQLVPEGCFPLLDCRGPHCRMRDRNGFDVEGAHALAATEALALTAACLRALASMEKGE